MQVVLIRHATTDYNSIPNKAWKNFSCLTNDGRKETEIISQNTLFKNSELILTSPYTRALETSSILSKNLNIPIKVEFDLREWEHTGSIQFEKELFDKCFKEMIKNKGKYLRTCKYYYEDLTSLGNRVFNVIRKYKDYKKIIVVSHEMVLSQFIYKDKWKNLDIDIYDFNDNSTPNGFIER